MSTLLLVFSRSQLCSESLATLSGVSLIVAPVESFCLQLKQSGRKAFSVPLNWEHICPQGNYVLMMMVSQGVNHYVRSDWNLDWFLEEKKNPFQDVEQIFVIHLASTSAVAQHLSSCVRQKVTINHLVFLMTCCKKTKAKVLTKPTQCQVLLKCLQLNYTCIQSFLFQDLDKTWFYSTPVNPNIPFHSNL